MSVFLSWNQLKTKNVNCTITILNTTVKINESYQNNCNLNQRKNSFDVYHQHAKQSNIKAIKSILL